MSELLELHSAQSIRVALEAIRNSGAGLSEHKQAMLNKVPSTGRWAKFPSNHLKPTDLAYLTAKTGDEFAILQGKNNDILFHGGSRSCAFDEELSDMLLKNKCSLLAHSHPGEDDPTPSPEDRETLEKIGQQSSILVSGRTGKTIEFTADLFEDLL